MNEHAKILNNISFDQKSYLKSIYFASTLFYSLPKLQSFGKYNTRNQQLTTLIYFFVQLADSTWTVTIPAACRVGIRLPTPILKWIIGKPFSRFRNACAVLDGLPLS